MTRFFYTDPLAAAWQAKHFGMRFAGGDSLRSACEAVGQPAGHIKLMPFEIHPASLSLLEVQLGDVICCGQFIGTATAIGEDRILAEATGFPPHASQLDIRDVAVIRRNGIPFMWPEREP